MNTPELATWLRQYAERAHVAPAEAERMREAAGRLESRDGLAREIAATARACSSIEHAESCVRDLLSEPVPQCAPSAP